MHRPQSWFSRWLKYQVPFYDKGLSFRFLPRGLSNVCLWCEGFSKYMNYSLNPCAIICYSQLVFPFLMSWSFEFLDQLVAHNQHLKYNPCSRVDPNLCVTCCFQGSMLNTVLPAGIPAGARTPVRLHHAAEAAWAVSSVPCAQSGIKAMTSGS